MKQIKIATLPYGFYFMPWTKENFQDLNYCAAQTIELAEIVSFDASPVNKLTILFYLFLNMIMVSLVVWQTNYRATQWQSSFKRKR